MRLNSSRHTYPAGSQLPRDWPAAPRSQPTLAAVLPRMLGLALLGLIALALLFTTWLAGSFFYYRAAQVISPGVTIAGQPVGGLTIGQAREEIHRVWNLERQIALTDGIRSWQGSPAQLGLVVDSDATARAAYAAGHGSGIFSDFSRRFQISQEGAMVAPVILLDADQAKRALQVLAPQVAIAPIDASLRLEGAQAIAAPGVRGYALDMEATLAILGQSYNSIMLAGQVPLKLAPIAPRLGDVSAAQAEAQRTIGNPPIIHIFDPITGEIAEWHIQPDEVASWLVISRADTQLVLSFDQARIRQTLDEISASFGDERWIDVDASLDQVIASLGDGEAPLLIIRRNPTVYIVGSGETLIRIAWKVGIPYWRIQRANPDTNLNSLRAGQEINLPSLDDLLPLPVVPNKRIVISITEQRLWTYENGEVRTEHVISTGIDRSPTQPGIFQVQTHELEAYASIWDLYMPHWLGIYEAWPGFMNGIHGLPLLSNGTRLWGNVLGRPASYGCIILDLVAAEDLYNWAEEGVVVEIQG